MKSADFPCTALYTGMASQVPGYCRPDPTLFDKQIHVESDNLLDVLEAFQPQDYSYVLNGSEESTFITDYITCLYFRTWSNDPRSSRRRIDKYEMQTALAEAGLPSIRQVKVCSSWTDSDLRKHLESFCFPAFCKPAFGYGSLGAFAAASLAEVKQGMDEHRQHREMEYVIQELICGKEYIIDTFSAEGIHHVCSIHKNQKELIQNRPLYRITEVEKDPEIILRCENYAVELLNALDFRNGPAHIEIFLQENGSIKLIEINNRISGGRGVVNKLAMLSGLTSQDAALRQLLKFGRVFPAPCDAAAGLARGLVLYKLTGGTVYDPMPKLDTFKTVRETIMLKAVGEELPACPQPSLLDAVCIILLHDHDEELVESETKAIFAGERMGILP
ncbi:acetyl-CoA carboxylase biotin carboxylase subunit family protein [Phyllobacterium phragmitis]